MSNSWPRVKLGEVLTRIKDEINVEDEQTYARLTIRMNGNGIILRDRVPGHEIGTKRQFLARAGQLVLSKIDARNGAFGILPSECDNAIITGNFWAFDVDKKRLLSAYFDYLTKTPLFVEFCVRASEGTTNRLYLQEDQFLAQQIMLPPLAEQARIVARVDDLAAQINEARGLRHQTQAEKDALLLNQVGQVFDRLSRQFPAREFGSFAPHVTSGPRNWAKHYEQSGFRFYRAQDIGPVGKLLEGSKVYITPPPGEQGRSAMLQRGDLMMVITGATVGRVSVFTDGLEPGFVSQHVAICRLPADQVNSEFVLWGLRGPWGQAQLLGQRYGQGKPGLNLSNIRALALPFPPLPEQRRTAAYLEDLQKQTNALKILQAETSSELDALMPSILDRAFRGEL